MADLTERATTHLINMKLAGLKDVPGYSPPPLRLEPTRPVMETTESLDAVAKLFRERAGCPLSRGSKGAGQSKAVMGGLTP